MKALDETVSDLECDNQAIKQDHFLTALKTIIPQIDEELLQIYDKFRKNVKNH